MDEDYNVESLHHLQEMSRALREQITLLERLAKSSKKSDEGRRKGSSEEKKTLLEQEKQTKLAKRRQEQEQKAAAARFKSLTVGKAQTLLLKQITNTVKSQLRADENLKGRGLDLATVTSKFQSSIDSMMGPNNASAKALAGYGLAQEAGTRMFEAGFRTNNEALMRVALAARVTHQNDKRMLKTLAANVAGSQMTNSSLTGLMGATERLAEIYHVTGSELIGAMEGMTEHMKTSDVLGLTGASMGVTQHLKGLVGTEFKEVGSIFQGLTAVDGYAKALLMGVGREREAYLKGGPGAQQAGIDMMLKAAKFMVAKRDSWLATGQRPDQVAADLKGIFGTEGFDLIRMQQQLNRRAGEGYAQQSQGAVMARTPEAKWTQTFEVFWDRVFSPLTEALNGLVEKFTQFLDSEKLKVATQGFLALAAAFGGFKGLTFATKLLKGGKGGLGRLLAGSLTKRLGFRSAQIAPKLAANVINNAQLAKQLKKLTGFGGTNQQRTAIREAIDAAVNAGKSEKQILKIFRKSLVANMPKDKVAGKLMGKITGEVLESFMTKKLGPKAASKIPGAAAVIGGYFTIDALLAGHYKQALMEAGSAIAGNVPGLGTMAAIGLDAGIIAMTIERSYDENYDKMLAGLEMTEGQYLEAGGKPREEVDVEFIKDALVEAFTAAMSVVNPDPYSGPTDGSKAIESHGTW